MENDLDLFRKRNEKKKKKKKSIVVDYPESTEVIFLGQGENGEAAVFSTDGNTTKCLSTNNKLFESMALKSGIDLEVLMPEKGGKFL